jgi:hypothetical protein
MTRLKIQDHAKERGLNLSQLHGLVNKRLDDPIAMGTMRRYWYSTKDGKESGPDIELVDLSLLGTVAQVLGVSVADLINEEELGVQ